MHEVASFLYREKHLRSTSSHRCLEETIGISFADLLQWCWNWTFSCLQVHCKTWWVSSTQTVWGNRLP